MLPERLIYQMNCENREKAIGSLIKSAEYLIYYSHVLDFDLVFEANRLRRKMAFVTTPENRAKLSDFSRRSSLVSKITLPSSLSEAVMHAPASDSPLALRVNFLTTEGLVDFELLESICNFSFFSEISPHDISAIPRDMKISVKFQLIHSDWISRRVLLSDTNIPLKMEFADVVNMIQLPSYPIFPEIDQKKIITPLSDVFCHEILVQPEKELQLRDFYCSPGFEMNKSPGQIGMENP